MTDPLKTPPPVASSIPKNKKIPTKIKPFIFMWGFVIGTAISLWMIKEHQINQTNKKAKEICHPHQLFDVALVGKQEYAICGNEDDFDLQPIN